MNGESSFFGKFAIELAAGDLSPEAGRESSSLPASGFFVSLIIGSRFSSSN
jgi:hypothetical protein